MCIPGERSFYKINKKDANNNVSEESVLYVGRSEIVSPPHCKCKKKPDKMDA